MEHLFGVKSQAITPDYDLVKLRDKLANSPADGTGISAKRFGRLADKGCSTLAVPNPEIAFGF